MNTFDEKTLKKQLEIDARALNIPPGSAEIFIKRTVSAVKSALKHKSIITDQDLTRLVSKELKKFHPDLAYVFKNRDTII